MEKLKKNFDGLDHGETGEEFSWPSYGEPSRGNLTGKMMKKLEKNFDDHGKDRRRMVMSGKMMG